MHRLTLGCVLASIWLGAERVVAQAPAGLAASALANARFDWVRREAPGVRAYFASGSYAARHQDSLLKRLPVALDHARRLIDTNAPQAPIDVFFIDSREDMAQLIRGRATGFADQAARAVFLVTNPAWRAFERHEVMHVVAWHAWGPPGTNNDWLQEGLAQAADARCDNYSNETVLRALVRRDGWVSFDDMLTKFRQQPDLRAYLQAAVFADYLMRVHGSSALEQLWRRGTAPDTMIGERTLRAIEAEWRTRVASGPVPDEAAMKRVDGEGCGGGTVR